MQGDSLGLKTIHCLNCLALLCVAGLCPAQQVFRTHDGEGAFDVLTRAASITDLDGDGVDDYVLGAPGVDAGGMIYVVSGATGSEIRRIVGVPLSNDFLGDALADAGDFDGDGVHDIIAGASGDSTLATLAGRADVYSGATGALLDSSYGIDPYNRYGRTVAGIGDVDGFDDVAVGGELAYANILGGPDGHLIRKHTGPWGRTPVSGLGDVNGDGRPDYIVGWPRSSVNGGWTGTARVYSGIDGSVIARIDLDPPVLVSRRDGRRCEVQSLRRAAAHPHSVAVHGAWRLGG